jgi:hypothetical protein
MRVWRAAAVWGYKKDSSPTPSERETLSSISFGDRFAGVDHQIHREVLHLAGFASMGGKFGAKPRFTSSPTGRSVIIRPFAGVTQIVIRNTFVEDARQSRRLTGNTVQ